MSWYVECIEKMAYFVISYSIAFDLSLAFEGKLEKRESDMGDEWEGEKGTREIHWRKP